MEADVFRSHCMVTLKKLLSRATVDFEWRTEQRIPRYGVIDLWGEKKDRLCLVELELRREDPVNNVIKIWRAFESYNDTLLHRRLVFVQVFSLYYQKHKLKMDNAVFAWLKMAQTVNTLSYQYMWFQLDPPVAGKPFPP